MRRLRGSLCGCALWLVWGSAVVAEEKPSDYLDREKQLAQTLEVRDRQGEEGRVWRVQPSGKWVLETIAADKEKRESEGTLTAKELAALAADLAKYSLSRLPDKEPERPPAKARTLQVRWGKQESKLILAATAELPKPNVHTVEGRYAGLLQSVQDRLQGKGYLTADGKLKRELRVTMLNRNTVRPVTMRYTVKTDGAWTSENVSGKQPQRVDSGTFDKKQLEALATALQKSDTARLPSKGVARPNANTAVFITIQWGSRVVTLNLTDTRPGQRYDLKTVEGRFQGIVDAVTRPISTKSS